MKKYIASLVVLMALAIAPALAQEENRPVKSAEEIALKQTQMLSRELSLSSEQQDTIYRIHLKYARQRMQSNTRLEALERMNNMTAEIVNVLTRQQRELFYNAQVNPEPRRPRQQVCHLGKDTL